MQLHSDKMLVMCPLIYEYIFAGSEKTYKCDLVLLAMGFLGPEKKIIDDLSVKTDPRGNLETPKNKYSTSIPKLYAAGGELLYS